MRDKVKFSLRYLNCLSPWRLGGCCLACLVKNSGDDVLKYFPSFSKEIQSDISCKLSPKETICMTCQILFLGKKLEKYHQFDVWWICSESGFNRLVILLVFLIGVKIILKLISQTTNGIIYTALGWNFR